MQIIAAWHQRIFKAHERGEFARFVIAFDQTAVGRPDRCRSFALPFGVSQCSGQIVAADAVDKFGGDALHAIGAFVHFIMPAAQGRVADQETRCFVQCFGGT